MNLIVGSLTWKNRRENGNEKLNKRFNEQNNGCARAL